MLERITVNTASAARVRSLRARLARRDGTDRADNDGGFTLIEVIVAFSLLMIVGIGLVYAIVNSTQVSNLTKQKIAAGNIARDYIEAARAQAGRSGAAVTSIASPVPVPGTPYRVCQSVSLTAPATPSASGCGSGSAECPSSTAGKTYYVSVTVAWDSKYTNTEQRVRSATVLAC